MSTNPNLSVPPGATAGEWDSVCTKSGLLVRPLVWSEHDTSKDDVDISGLQFEDGSFSRDICVWLVEGKQLTSAEARQLARTLIAAADELDRLQVLAI